MNQAQQQLETLETTAREYYQSRLDQLRAIFDKIGSDSPEANDEGWEEFYDYGLSIDYVHPYTFEGQRAPYWRWQISWGGPSDEFRIYVDQDNDIQEIEYVYLNWGECWKVDALPEGDVFEACQHHIEALPAIQLKEF